MSREFYLLLHLLGVFTVLLSLGGIALQALNGGTREHRARKMMAISHGVGLLIIFIAGFGLLAKLGYHGSFPGWAIGKMVIWLLLGALPTLFYRQQKIAKGLWFLTLALAITAAWLAVMKPF